MNIIALYNLKGGVGKTAGSVNFAHLAAASGYQTLLWDLDPQGASGYYFGIDEERMISSKKLLKNGSRFQEGIISTQYDRLDLLPAALSDRKLDLILHDDYKDKHLKTLLKSVKKKYDLIFIDCPPGFSTLADSVFLACDILLMPVIPTTLSLRTYDIVKKYLSKQDIAEEKLTCYFSMVDTRKNMHTEMMDFLIKDGCFFEHYIPYLSDVEKMGTYQQPVMAFAPGSYAATCYKALWQELEEGIF